MSANSDVELPLWLARVLASTGMVVVERGKMKGFEEQFRDDLEADANNVSFARLPYFYTIGVIISQL